jgi:hypothetical protein
MPDQHHVASDLGLPECSIAIACILTGFSKNRIVDFQNWYVSSHNLLIQISLHPLLSIATHPREADQSNQAQPVLFLKSVWVEMRDKLRAMFDHQVHCVMHHDQSTLQQLQ